MRKQTLLAVLTVVLCALVVAGGLLASNMAFQVNYRLNTSAANGGVGTGKNSLSLPYVREAGLSNVNDLMLDIGSGSLAPVLSVSRFSEVSGTYEVYTGRMGSPLPAPFALVAGEGYFVSMASNVNYRLVGAHDPSLVIPMNSPGATSIFGRNYLAPPYNIVARNGLELMRDIGGGTITPISSVSRFNPVTDTFQVYTGRMGSPTPSPFVLSPGEAYFLSMNTTIPYIPSHY